MAKFEPPFCPHADCDFHTGSPTWRYRKKGFYRRQWPPQRIQRYTCSHCRRSFSTQTFHGTYWLKRPDLLEPTLGRLVACSAFRQIAREFQVSPSTVARHSARLGRACLLFEEQHRLRGPVSEPLVLDGLRDFEYSQYHPFEVTTLVGARSHLVYQLTLAELRRSGRMRAAQRRRRERFEARHGRADPRARERSVIEGLRLVAREPQGLEIRSDQDPAYPRAFRRCPELGIQSSVTPSTAPRSVWNPLFPANLVHGLMRHGGANHKRETIAFSKRRQSALERLFVFRYWRNRMKSFSERKRDRTPAQRLGLETRRRTAGDVVRQRLFVTRVGLPEVLMRYYRREVDTRPLPSNARHALRYAF